MIVVTGATGKLGRLVIEGLLKTGPASDIVAAARNPAKAADLSARGIEVREADYSKPETLRSAFAGAEKVLLISSSEVGQRVVQHKAVVDAAKGAGAELLVYTSALRADISTLGLAAEHKATEEYIGASSLDFILLRNGWYLENHTEQLGPALEHGAVLGAAGDGRFASAARADYAAAAVAVLTSAGHANRIYELVGDVPYTLTELAAEVSAQSGTSVVYKNLPPRDYENTLVSFGMPPAFAAIVVDSDLAASRGELTSASEDLRSLIGHTTTTLADAVGHALSNDECRKYRPEC